MNFLETLESTAFSAWVLTSMLGFPTLIALHSIGMAVAAGLTFVVTLCLHRFATGIADASLPGILHIATWGFLLNLVTGLAIFVPRGGDYITNLTFVVKMLLVLISASLLVWLKSHLTGLVRGSRDVCDSAPARHLSLVSSATWGWRHRHGPTDRLRGIGLLMGLEKLGWLVDTPVGEWVVSSAVIWPTLECIHFVSLSVFMGGMLMIDLRLTGFYSDPCTELINRMLRLVLGAFLVNFTTGALFFAGNAPKYIDNPAFELKLALIALAGLNALYFKFRLSHLLATESVTASSKLVGYFSLLLWAGVIVCGRMITFFAR